jgi:serine/threonine protein kinase
MYWFSQWTSSITTDKGDFDSNTSAFSFSGSASRQLSVAREDDLSQRLLGAHAVAAEGSGHAEKHPLQDCIIPSLELMKIPNQQPLEGGVGYIEKYMFRQQLVAVKKLLQHKINKATIKEMQHEVSVLRTLSHPHIVDFKGVWFDPPRIGIVMEMCRMDLYDALTEERQCSPRRCFPELRSLRVARDIADGMNYLHTRSPMVSRIQAQQLPPRSIQMLTTVLSLSALGS